MSLEADVQQGGVWWKMFEMQLELANFLLQFVLQLAMRPHAFRHQRPSQIHARSSLFVLYVIDGQVLHASDTRTPDAKQNLLAFAFVTEIDGLLGVRHGMAVDLDDHIPHA